MVHRKSHRSRASRRAGSRRSRAVKRSMRIRRMGGNNSMPLGYDSAINPQQIATPRFVPAGIIH